MLVEEGALAFKQLAPSEGVAQYQFDGVDDAVLALQPDLLATRLADVHR
jgi:hypothetical protein